MADVSDEEIHEHLLRGVEQALAPLDQDARANVIAAFSHILGHINELKERVAKLEKNTSGIRTSGGKTFINS